MDASVGLVQALLPVIAHVSARVAASHPSARILGTERMGSAVVVDPGGLLLTVNYVVMGARRVRVTMTDGRRLEAKVAAQDFESGLALLRVPAAGLPAARLASSDEIALGASVFVLASTGPTDRRVAGGIVTDLGEFEAYWEYMLDRGIVSSASNPGFGGGPCSISAAPWSAWSPSTSRGSAGSPWRFPWSTSRGIGRSCSGSDA